MTHLRLQRISLLVLLFTATPGFPSCPDGSTPWPIFYARSLANPEQRAILLETAIGGAGYRGTTFTRNTASLKETYENIYPEKSLFIHDCSLLCGVDEFSFSNRLSVAAKLVDPQNPQRIVSWWQTQMLRDFSVNSSDLEIAAVVNRLDFAKWNSSTGNWENPELRFVYAPTNNNVKFRLILEFVLEPMDDPSLRRLAKDWYALSSLKGVPFLSKLKSITTERKIAYARLRTNFNPPGHGQWSLAQWEFRSGSNDQKPLTDQVYSDCTESLTAGEPTRPQDCTQFKDVWVALLSEKSPLPHLPFSWPIIYPKLVPTTMSYGEADILPVPEGLGPAAVPAQAPRILDARDLLAVQQCSFCHGSETDTNFTHVGEKRPDGTRELSKFLTGTNPKPPFAQYCSNDPSQFARPVQLTFLVPPSLSPNKELSETRYFHDFGRRMMSLATILLEPPKGSSRTATVEFQAFRLALIRNYAPHAIH